MLLATTLVFFAFTRTEAGRAELLRQAEQQFASRFDGSLEIGSIDGNVVYAVLARDVVVRAPNGSVVASVDSIRARPTWSGLLRRSLDFDRLEIIGAHVHLERGPSGAWNAEEALRARRFARDSTALVPTVILPRLTISRATIRVSSDDAANGRGPDRVVFDYLNSAYSIRDALVAMDWSSGSLQVDVIHFAGAVEDPDMGLPDLPVTDATGQLVFDEEGIKLNELRVVTPRSDVQIVGSIAFTSSGRTLGESQIEARIVGDRVDPAELTRVFPRQPLRAPVGLRLHASGNPGDFTIHEAALDFATSRVLATGTVSSSADSVRFDVGFNMPFLSLADFNTVAPGPFTERLVALDTLIGDVWAQGSIPLDVPVADVFDADLQAELQTGAGGVSASGWIQRRGPDASYQLNLSVADIDAARVSNGALRPSRLTGSAFVASSSVHADRASGLLQLRLYDSIYGEVPIDSLSANFAASEGNYDGVVELFQHGGLLTGDVALGFEPERRFLNADLRASALNLGSFFRADSLSTRMDGRAEVRLTEFAERSTGAATIHVERGEVQRGNFAVELGPSRSTATLTEDEDGFRATIGGDLVDANFSSTLSLKRLVEVVPGLSARLVETIGLLAPRTYPLEGAIAEDADAAFVQHDHMRLQADVSLRSDSVLVALLARRDFMIRNFSGVVDVIADSLGLTTNADLQGLSVGTGGSEFTRPEAKLSLFVPTNGDPAGVAADAELTSASASDGRTRVLSPAIDLRLEQGVLKGRVEAAESDAVGPVDVGLTASFGGGVWNASFDQLLFEAAGYQVSTSGPHVIRLFRNAISTQGFTLVSPGVDGDEQRLAVRGTYSGRDVDTLSVSASSIDLDALSSLVDFSTRLSGSVNGTVDIARSANSPMIAGNGTIANLGLDQRILGDVSVTSRFLGSRDEVAVSAHLTPAEQAGRRAERGEGPGIEMVDNDISVDGGIRFGGTASGRAEMDLTAEIRRADLFFFEYLFPHTIDEVVGQVRGTGRIRGTLARPVFDAELDLEDASFAIPEFNLSLDAAGKITVDRDAIRIASATVTDQGGGSASLSGDILFNEYRYFSVDLIGDLEALQIMNIDHSLDLPFYGNIRGSGRVTLDGPLSGATLRAASAQTSADSEVYIPIVEPIGVSDQSFIIFADSTGKLIDPSRDRRANVLDRRPPGERSFLDGLELDLNIFAPPGSTVNLVIDPLLGDVINAVGSGRVQIRRQGGEFSTFGSLEVNSGDYLFTAGDVFVRRFLIDSGGTITWDGDPTNAILDIPASYRTRASRAGLPGTEGTGSTIPLIVRLRITGRVATPQVELSLEVDRTNREVTGNYAALEAILNQPSRSTEYATSVLVTNSFLLTTSDANADVLASSAFNSVSHLVGSQINRYLNEALPNVDFSFGVQGESTQELGVTYGIALRLLDERLLIRGQGIYQGGQDNASTAGSQNLEGEFVVEVRLNPTVSVEVFYRREGDVLTSASTLTGSTGAGVTYRTEFSTWRRFFSRIFGTGTDTATADS